MEEFDFIVVGGGPGGCVSASRLSEDPAVKVALREAGPDRRGFLGDCAAVGSITLAPRKSSNNWGFESTPQPGLNGRSDYHALGRGLGGGSSINTLMYMRGHRLDYDHWAALGNPGWSYAEVLPYFRKSGNNQTHRDEFHGTDGPMWVEELRTDNPYHAIVKKACAEAGLPFNPDFNGAEQEGYNCTQVMMKGGVRFGVGKAYIHPHLGKRKNLQLFVDTECARVLFEGKRAVGVEVEANGARRQMRAQREVIVAGGGVLSAKLLQLSGVGDGRDLRPLGIPVVHDLPGVGQNLSDHIDVVLGCHIPGEPNLIGISPTGAMAIVKAMSSYRREKRGMLATNFAELTGFMRLTSDSPKPEIQYEFVIVLALDHGRKVIAKHGMSCHVLLLHPKSRGEIRLTSSDPRWRPTSIRTSSRRSPDDGSCSRASSWSARSWRRPGCATWSRATPARRTRRTRRWRPSYPTASTPSITRWAPAAWASTTARSSIPASRFVGSRACAWPTRRSCRA